MKKTLFIILAVFLFIPGLVNAEDNINLVINGNVVQSDVSPVIENGRTLIPIRVISENLGYKVDWFDSTQIISIGYYGMVKNAKDDKIFNILRLKVNDTEMTVDNPKAGINNKINLEVAPKIINGRTMVPVRAISENMGWSIEWDENSKTVTVTNNLL